VWADLERVSNRPGSQPQVVAASSELALMGHGLHSAAPSYSVYVSAAHVRQTAEDIALLAFENEPAEQFRHLCTPPPFSKYAPAPQSQLARVLLPGGDVAVVGQSRHALPPCGEYESRGQIAHGGPPAGPEKPATHLQLSLPAGAVALPAQGRHIASEEAPVDAEYVLFGHLEHALRDRAPVPLLYVPEGQLSH